LFKSALIPVAVLESPVVLALSAPCPIAVLSVPVVRLWYGEPDHAIGYAMHSSRSHDAVIRVYDEAGTMIEAREHKGDFKEP
jgi:hypothetical protein